MTSWRTRIRRRGQAAVRGPHAHGPGDLEIPESRRCGGAETGTPPKADARRERGSVFGCEGFGPDQLRFHVATPRLAGVAADGIHSRNAREEDDAAAWRHAAAGETQAAEPGRPGIAVTRANETMMCAVAVFVGNEV